ncbi:xylose isomerase [Shewanella surugensis]|uniref:Xylose isomerase n=1 Tax=Shewanella surugensis TaxID=212020 RepID=A0ABT0L9U2_9GAMM|nr:xylose isomerase [Shewanella surugensis]MCL1123921.1 xylose isomerase [Shewanella surugensis]
MSEYFSDLGAIQYEATDASYPLSFRFYDEKRLVLGQSMKQHCRFAACYWHNFCWNGVDIFGEPAFDRPWHQCGDPLKMAKLKADVAFEFFAKLGVPFYTFHDTDVSPEGDSPASYLYNFNVMQEVLATKQQDTGLKPLWGTANLFTHKRYMSGAATNPDPDIFAYAAMQVCNAMRATHELGGENYVIWGGREGYETLLNTDLKQERMQLARFLNLIVEHKHKIGFEGTLLIEPKPQEPTKHQYDYDTSAVYAFLSQFGLEKEFKVNIEANHATLAGHSYHHEVSNAFALGIFGSLDANRGDPQLGWDTDQFPNSVEEMTLICYEILKHGGFTTGGFNFDTKLRRQSIDKKDLFHAHIGAMDTIALGLLKAERIILDEHLSSLVTARYKGWSTLFGQDILNGEMSLQVLMDYVAQNKLNPQGVTGQQEALENYINRMIYK